MRFVALGGRRDAQLDLSAVVRLSLLWFAAAVSGWLTFWAAASNLHFGYLGDFTIFWLVGQQPVDWLYTDLDRLPFPYPPSSLFLFHPWAALPQFVSLALWDALGLAAFIFAARRIAGPVPIALGLLSYAAAQNLLHGQTGLIVGALVILGITDRRPWVAGILLGAAAAIKPQSVIAVPLALLLTKEYRTLLWAGATGAALVGLSAIVWGVTPWLHWLAALDDFRVMVAARNIQTIGLTGWAYALGLLLAPFTLLHFRQDRYASIVIAGVLLSPYSMPYDLAGMTIVAIAILLERKHTPLEWIGAALIVSSAFATAGLATLAVALNHKHLRPRRRLPEDDVEARLAVQSGPGRAIVRPD